MWARYDEAMLTSGIIGIALVAALVLIVGTFNAGPRKRRATSDSGAGWTGDGGNDCDGGSDGGCSDGGGGDGGGGGGD
jgi:hypothetical protein